MQNVKAVLHKRLIINFVILQIQISTYLVGTVTTNKHSSSNVSKLYLEHCISYSTTNLLAVTAVDFYISFKAMVLFPIDDFTASMAPTQMGNFLKTLNSFKPNLIRGLCDQHQIIEIATAMALSVIHCQLNQIIRLMLLMSE